VLDFGLAKAIEDPATPSDPANSPTLTAGATRMGAWWGRCSSVHCGDLIDSTRRRRRITVERECFRGLAYCLRAVPETTELPPPLLDVCNI
jgi:hypothetical protein